jgi:Fe-S-cluster containining protein
MPPDASLSLPSLPCFPCPHRATCCAHGTTVSPEEARDLIAEHGAEKVYRTRWGEWRTRVVNGRCVFFDHGAGGCRIHDRPYYPAVCRGFPWIDAETGGPYQFDRTICLEFVRRPELLEIHPPPRRRAAERVLS